MWKKISSHIRCAGEKKYLWPHRLAKCVINWKKNKHKDGLCLEKKSECVLSILKSNINRHCSLIVKKIV